MCDYKKGRYEKSICSNYDLGYQQFDTVNGSAVPPPVENTKENAGTYFSVPESDGVDASTGASRLIASDKMYGATEYVAKVIADVTSADLFQIKTAQAYPSRSHKN